MKKFFFSVITILSLLIFSGCKSEFDDACKNLTCYDLEIVFDNESMELSCVENVSYLNNTDSVLGSLDFHLYPNAFREGAKTSVVSLSSFEKAYPNGKDYGYIEIESCLQNESALSYTICGEDENILSIKLPCEVYPNESISFSIKFGVKIPNINHRFGYGESTVNIANFYPIACVYENGQFDHSLYNSNGDPFFSEMANYNVKIELSDEFVVANTGKKDLLSTNDGKKIISMSACCVRDFAIVLSKKFEVISEKCDDTLVEYYFYDDDNATENLKCAVDSLNTFEKLFGDYPYSTLSVVKTNFVHGGMEYPNLVYISDDITEKSSYQEVIIHEIAHQWWYNLVGNDAYENSWLDEGLTEYSTALFYEKNPQYNTSLQTIMTNANKNWNLFEKIYSSVDKDFSRAMNRSLDEYSTEYEYTFCTYVRGMILFDDLRHYIGDTKFFKGLKYYFEENKYKISSPAKLISAFEKASKTSLEGFFNSYIEGKVLTISQ